MSEFEMEKFKSQKSELQTSIGIHDPHFSKHINQLIIEKNEKIELLKRMVGITMNEYISQLNDEEKHVLESMKENWLDEFLSSYLSKKQMQEAISSMIAEYSKTHEVSASPEVNEA